jgi:uncharacterized membrane protein (UPF0127 family)
MAGQASVVIGTSTWLVYLAVEDWELRQGLGGLVGIDPNTGMFFDTGIDQAIQVTTEPMLFNIDIVFISSDLKVTEVQRDVPPGNEITASTPARYFLEVNGNEAAGVNVGDDVRVTLAAPPAPVVPIAPAFDLSSTMESMMKFAVFAVGIIMISKWAAGGLDKQLAPK